MTWFRFVDQFRLVSRGGVWVIEWLGRGAGGEAAFSTFETGWIVRRVEGWMGAAKAAGAGKTFLCCCGLFESTGRWVGGWVRRVPAANACALVTFLWPETTLFLLLPSCRSLEVILACDFRQISLCVSWNGRDVLRRSESEQGAEGSRSGMMRSDCY